MSGRLPSYGLAGTPAAVALEDLNEARAAVATAAAAVLRCEPNGRDFVGRQGYYQEARAAHVRRLRDLEAIGRELDEQAEHAADVAGGAA